MTWQLSLNAVGGLALFLLAMLMMTQGLKTFAGGALKQLLGQWTSTPLRGVFSGMLVTGVVQSSSAAIAIILTAAAGGMVGIEAAAAAVIGANIGTTSTAALAVLKATPSAKRLALGHIAFNVIPGAIANFVARVRTESMPPDVADDLARALRLARYLNEAARIAPRAHALRQGASRLADAGLQRLQLGSTAERVVRPAPCPVLVVREREKEFA